MIIGIILAFLFAGILWWVLGQAGELKPRAMLPRVIMGGYVLRILIQFVIRDIQFFSHAIGGDALNYEYYAQLIALLWQRTGIYYVTADDFASLGATTLPSNMFAFLIFLNGGETTRLGCTALVALAAALTAVNMYKLAVQFGAEPKNALLMSSIIYLEPAFLFYTSDMYKDGIVLCLAIGALASALRLSIKVTLKHAVIGSICLLALWYVRFYLVFATAAPLLVGIVGIGNKKMARPVIMAVLIGGVILSVAMFTDLLQIATERASETFDQATAARSIMGNYKAGTGSGVKFDDGGKPYGALPAKLAYTVFSPFPWAGGSLGFQLGKLDVFLWYFMLYRAVRAAWVADRRVVLMFLTFAVPCTVMYAMTMANVGLIVRQRLIIVAATAILAATYTPKKVVRTKPARGAAGSLRPRPKLPARNAAA